MSGPTAGISALFAFAFLAIGCSNPELTRRYAHATYVEIGRARVKPPKLAETPYARASAFAIPTPTPKSTSTSVANLSDRGQAALVEAMQEQTAGKGALALAQGVGAALKPAPKTTASIDRRTIKRRVVFSVVKQTPHDRYFLEIAGERSEWRVSELSDSQRFGIEALEGSLDVLEANALEPNATRAAWVDYVTKREELVASLAGLKAKTSESEDDAGDVQQPREPTCDGSRKADKHNHARPRFQLTGADRLQQVSLQLVLLTPVTLARFKSWNRFETQFETVDLGKVNLIRVSSVSGNVAVGGDTSAGNPVSGGIEGTYSRTLGEEVNLRQRYVLVSGELTAQSATVYQQGVVGIDLTGNAVMDIELFCDGPKLDLLRLTLTKMAAPTTRPATAAGSVPKVKTDLSPQEARVALVPFRYPANTGPVEAEMYGWYTLRHAGWGRRQVVEGYHWVTFLRGPLQVPKANIVLISDSELRALRSRWRLVHVDPSGTKTPLTLAMHDATRPVWVETRGEAIELLRWLRDTDFRSDHTGIRIGDFDLMIDKRPANKSDVTRFRVEEYTGL